MDARMWRGIVTTLLFIAAASHAARPPAHTEADPSPRPRTYPSPQRPARPDPFIIEIVDEQTNRGVPLVEIKTTSSTTFVTDSNGLAAIDEPSFFGARV